MIYIVRHGETQYNIEKRVQGWAQNPLNENGVTQAKKVAEKIAKLPIEHFYSSDLKRARQTAEIINEKLNLKIIYDERLREFRSYEEMTGDLKDNLPSDFAVNPHKYNAESLRDVFKRVKQFLDELKAKRLDNVLIVCHGACMAVIDYMLNNPDKTANDIPDNRIGGSIPNLRLAENTGIFEYELYQEGVTHYTP